jgi:hypothetical protein
MEILTFDTIKYVLVINDYVISPNNFIIDYHVVQPNNRFYVSDEYEIFDTIEECENRLLWWYFVDLNKFKLIGERKIFFPFSKILTSQELNNLKENNPELFDRYTKR